MKRRSIFLVLLFLIAVALRLAYLTDIPYRVDGDASRFALDAISYWQTFPPLFSTGWQGHTNLYFYFVGAFIRLFSNDLFALRFVSAIGGVLGVWATYLFAKELFDKKTGLLAAFFLTISPFHLVFSRVGTEVIWMTFFAPITFYLLLKRKSPYVFFSGLTMGLAQYFYPGARLIPILYFALLILILICGKIKPRQALLFFYLGTAGFIVIYSPMIYYYVLNPESYWARVNIVGVFESKWLTQELETKNIGIIFLNQLKQSFLAFHYPVRNLGYWYVRTPFLDILPMILSSIGLISALINIRDYRYKFLYIYLISGMILGGMLTIDSPMPSRYIILFPAVVIFISIGVISFINLVNKKLRTPITSFILLIALVSGLWSYYTHETKDIWNFDRNTQVATYAGRYLSTIPKEYNAYFLSDGSMDANFPTIEFLAGRKITDIGLFSDIVRADIQPDKKNVFIVLPTQNEKRMMLKKAFNKSREEKVHNPRGEFLFWIIETKSS